MVHSAVLATQMVAGSSPEPPPMLVDMSACLWIKKGSASMLTSIQSAGVTPEVNLKITQVKKRTKGTRSSKQGYQ